MSIWALVDELLPETVQHAQKTTPFYGGLYQGIDCTNVDRHRLKDLPTIDKGRLKAARESRLSTDVRTAFVGNTSGSTGQFLLIHRSSEEQAFVAQFFAEYSQQYQADTNTIVFALSLPSHGSPIAIPSASFVVSHCIIDNRTADNFLAYLLENSEIAERPKSKRIIQGALTQVLLFTKYCLFRNIAPSKLEIGQLIVSGEYLSPSIRTLLETLWAARVVNRYSLSEVFGGATQSDNSGDYTFDPYVYPELAAIDEECGELILTSLYPFVQRQPMIRYRTGDIFSLGCRENGFKYRGRVRHCLFDPRDASVILFGSDVYDVLDTSLLVAREVHSLGVSATQHSATGKPIARGRCGVRGRKLEVELEVGCVIDPNCFVKQTKEEAGRIIDNLSRIIRKNATLSITWRHARENDAISEYSKSGIVWRYDDN